MAVDVRDFAAEIPEKILWFGAYPCTPGTMTALLDKGITAFLDLTTEEDISILGEKYNVGERYILPDDCIRLHVPIKDQRCPIVSDASLMVDWTQQCLLDGRSVYIHCRGGHGRAALVTALVLMSYDDGMSAQTALDRVHAAHQKRRVMEPRWRKLGAPQTRTQKQFVLNWKKR
jgi:protein-tyrosine phosphatase